MVQDYAQAAFMLLHFIKKCNINPYLPYTNYSIIRHNNVKWQLTPIGIQISFNL